jgi:hypothetical protein
MRFVLALGLLLTLSCSADAAKVRHVPARYYAPSAVVNSWAYQPPRPSFRYDDSPSYYDASKFGGSTALPAR